jgi:hypothetical protein
MICIIPETNIISIQYNKVIPDDFVEKLNSFIMNTVSMHNRFVIHMDLKGLNITTLMKNRAWVESLFYRIDANYYESFLQEVCIFNAPFISKQIYSIMTRFVKNIKTKVKFVPKNITADSLIQIEKDKCRSILVTGELYGSKSESHMQNGESHMQKGNLEETLQDNCSEQQEMLLQESVH